jgi:hypothetical protein
MNPLFYHSQYNRRLRAENNDNDNDNDNVTVDTVPGK